MHQDREPPGTVSVLRESIDRDDGLNLHQKLRLHKLIDADTDVFKSCLISKRPGTTGDPLHQDYPRWPGTGDVSPDDFVKVLMPIDPFNLDNGAIELFPGYHRHRLEEPTEEPRDVERSQVDLSKGIVLTLNPGDFVLFHVLLPHRSGPNRTSRNRESLFITYVRSGH